jgi:hypothetical protein
MSRAPVFHLDTFNMVITQPGLDAVEIRTEEDLVDALVHLDTTHGLLMAYNMVAPRPVARFSRGREEVVARMYKWLVKKYESGGLE